jgi:hypothetical protein
VIPALDVTTSSEGRARRTGPAAPARPPALCPMTPWGRSVWRSCSSPCRQQTQTARTNIFE